MTSTHIPPSINTLTIITQNLSKVQGLFQHNSQDAIEFDELLSQARPLDELPAFKTAAPLVTYIQLLLLATISMMGGISTPQITYIHQQDEQVSIGWKQNKYVIELGKYNRKMTEFINQVGTQLLSKKKYQYPLTLEFLTNIHHLLKQYSQNIQDSISRLQEIISNQNQLVLTLKNNQDPDLFFIILSSLPSDSLNALYLHIQNFFDPELHLKNTQGTQLHIKYLFQMPTNDIHFLIEKLKIHFNLYFFSETPEIRDTIQKETHLYLEKILMNKDVREETIDHIIDVKKNQLEIRQQLYDVLSGNLGLYINNKSLAPS